MNPEGGIVGVVTSADEELRLTLYSRREGKTRAIAIVVGSEPYVLRALVAVGLPPPISLPKYGDRRHGRELPLVGDQPADGNAKRPR